MKNNYLIRKKDRLPWSSRFLTVLMLLGVFSMFTHQKAQAQSQCAENISFTVQFIDALVPTGQSKMVLSGIPDNFSAGFVAGDQRGGSITSSAYTSYTLATEPNTLGRYLSTTMVFPTLTETDPYTVRVLDPVMNCYTDSLVQLPRVNFSETPTYTDVEVEVNNTSGPGTSLGSNVTVEVVVSNTNDDIPSDPLLETATDVQIIIRMPQGGVVLVGTDDAPNVTNNGDGTYTWTVGDLAPDASRTLTITYTLTSRGVYEIQAEEIVNTTTPRTTKDFDSAPNDLTGIPDVNFHDEDDEGSTCISSPWDWCTGDRFLFRLANSPHITTANVVWKYSPDGIAAYTSPIPAGVGFVQGDSLIITAPGFFNYDRIFGGLSECDAEGCCPIEVQQGIRPDLSDIAPQAICFDDVLPLIQTIDNTPNTAYPNDRGPAVYQWYNNNGSVIGNDNIDPIAGNDTTVLDWAGLPTVPGVYQYRIKAWDSAHTSCIDSTDVTFTITDIAKPITVNDIIVCEEDDFTVRIANNTDYPTGPDTYVFNWWFATDSAAQNNADSTWTRSTAQTGWEGDYIVRVYASFTISGIATAVECEKRDTMNVIVNPLPSAPELRDKEYCQFDPLEPLLWHVVDSTSDSRAATDYLNWFLSPTEITNNTPHLTNSPAINPNPFDSNTPNSYPVWVSITDELGCTSHIDTFRININAIPVAPAVEDLAYCEDPSNTGVVPLTATTTPGNFQLVWYGTATGDDSSQIAPTPNISVIDTLYFYVAQKFMGDSLQCESFRDTITVFVKDVPERPAFDDPTFCQDPTGTINLITYYTESPNSTTGSDKENIVWQYPGYVTDIHGSTSPVAQLDSAGSTYGIVYERFGYVRPTGGTDTLWCDGPQEDYRVIVNPTPAADLIVTTALCDGETILTDGKMYITEYRDTDTIQWHPIAAVGDPFVPASVTETDLGVDVKALDGLFADNLTSPSTGNDYYIVRVTTEFGCFADIPATMPAKVCQCPGGYCEPAVIDRLL